MRIFSFSKTFEGRKVLDMPEFELCPGKIYAVIGANGSGKSTMARIIAGVITADRKGLRCDAGSVAYMPQKNYGFRMSTEKNLLLAGSDKERAARLMERLQLSHLAATRADRLSGGETARMALARLMMGRYELVILDEPTAAMDMESTALAEELIVEYVRETGCTLLLVTHSLQQARRIADEAIYMHKGRLLEHGAANKLLYEPACPETRQFLEFYGL